MGSSLGGLLDKGDAGNIATMKSVIDKFEKIKDERAGTDNSSSSSPAGSGSSDSIIHGASDKTLFNGVERDIAAVAEPLDGGRRGPNAISTAAVGTPPSHFDSCDNRNAVRNSCNESDSSSSDGGNRQVCLPRNPSTVHHHQQVEHQENHPETLNLPIRAPCILVVDDSRVSCQIAKRSLSKANFHVELALGGEQGMAMLRTDSASFDLVLLDVVMPGLDGVEVLTRMKQDPRLRHLPVAILSGLEDERLEKLCLQQGATAVLRKPMMADDIVRVVNTCCIPKMAAAAAAAVAAVAAPAANSTCTPVELAVESIGSSSLPLLPSWSPLSPSRPPMSPPAERSGIAKRADGVDSVNFVRGSGVCDRGDGGGYVSASDGNVRGAVVAGGEDGADGGFEDGCDGGERASPSCSRGREIHVERDALQGDTAAAAAGERAPPSHSTTGAHDATTVVVTAAAIAVATATAAAATAPVSPIRTSAEGSGGCGRLENESSRSPPCGGPLSPMGHKAISKTRMTALIVDDSVISSKLAIRKLRTLGYAAISAENGRAALDILRRFPDRVSFVLVDIVMPVMNGVELLHVIKNDPSLCQIPVVVVSSLEKQQLENLCLESGALAVLRKPLNTDEIQSFAAQMGLALPTSPPARTTQRVHPSIRASPVVTAAAATRATAV